MAIERITSKMRKTLVIAEAGVNHNGDLQIAKKLVDAALQAGADVIKFQTFQASQLVTEYAEQADYQQKALGTSNGQMSMLRMLELQPSQHQELIAYCQYKGIEFLSSAFDLPSIDLLASFKLKRWKIPSGEITNLPYLRAIGARCQPILLSTGMANLGEIEAALEVLEKAGAPRRQIIILHCTTEYPAPPGEVNLRAMQSIAQSFGVEVGYSDHTDGIDIPIAAVAMGAKVIEKHLTLNRNMSGPDHKASLTPNQFTAMVKGIRTVEMALGDGIKRPSQSEKANLPLIRKSLYAASDIRAGEKFTHENIVAKRPGNSLSPMEWDCFIGKISSFNYSKDDPLRKQN